MKRYRARYITKDGKEGVKDWDCSSPITALNNIHRFMQEELGIAPTDYTITSLAHVYNGTTKGYLPIESKFDLPNSQNPTVNPPEDDLSDFPTVGDLCPEAHGGKLSD